MISWGEVGETKLSHQEREGAGVEGRNGQTFYVKIILSTEKTPRRILE